MIVLIYLFNLREIIKIQVCRSGWGFTSQNTPVRSVKKKKRVDFSIDLTPDEKLHLLSQLYISQLKGFFVVKEKRQKATIIGVVKELSPQTLSIRTNEGYRLIEVADILEIRLWEEGVYD